ncbi:MAG: LPS-assembly protein LptD [Lewinellaceae bacterium]|nr:LPS-assembly protein LptD [Saprospiraceae bacterium]MCB9340769.1 LPS-assembly protein LptD [Lewinellaceae bacterium]
MLVLTTLGVSAQVSPLSKSDSLFAKNKARPPFGVDSLPSGPAARANAQINWDSVKLSPDALEEKVAYKAADSMFFDLKNKQIHLYGQAEVNYQQMTMTADYIVIDWVENIMTADGRKDPQGKWIGKPTFKEGDQTFSASKLRYNFKTYKGIIYDAQTTFDGMNVVSRKGKFFGAGEDTTAHNTIYSKSAIFSTCDLEEPHFGIRSNKQKIIQDKVAVVGPSNIEIGGVPTPIWLPFGFFPLKIGKSTGLIFPNNYEYSDQWGFGLKRVGWYFPVSDIMDLTVTGDVYMKGTFRVDASSNYAKRYKYRGGLALGFAYQRGEVEGKPVYDPSFNINWRHTQDAKAHPYRNFGGNITMQTNNYRQANNPDANSQLQSSISSNMNLTQRFDKPFDLTASFNHSQNTQTRQVTVNFPTINFQTQTLYPFKRRLQTGKERFYEKIQLRYTGEAKNTFTATDTTLFTKQTLDDAKYGVRHNLTTATSFNLLKYFTFTPSASYKEVWYFKTLDKTFDPTIQAVFDTVYNEDSTEILEVLDSARTKFGQVVEMENFGLKPFRQYNAGMSMSTKVFGTLLFKKGKLRGIRHVLTPTFGFSFTPDYTNPDWGYFKYVQTDLRDDEKMRYSIYENNRLSGFDQPATGGRQMLLTYGFANLLEAKLFSKRDSTLKNVKLFNSISVNGNYNFAADSLNWSTVTISGNTNFFNNITSFRFGATLDPYDFNRKTGARINKYNLDTNGKLLRLTTWNFNFSTNITVKRLRDFIKGINTDEVVANQTDQENPNASQEQDLLSIFENFRIAHNFTVTQRYDTKSQKDTILISTHTLSSSGSIKLTDNWNVTVGNFGYDFQSKRITYPDFSFSRDLHCWEMGVSWRPYLGTYSFFIRVKPGKLDFISIPYGKGQQDGFGGRF